jgi:GH24 family phage-related lysozyme (muramidase)
MNLALIKKWITRWESTRFAAYDDKTGKPITPTTILVGKAHIGVGFDLEAPGAEAIVAGLHLDYAGIKAGRVIITADQVDELLDATVAPAVTGARILVPTIDIIPADKQIVIADLTFNMGKHGLSKFVNTLQAIKDQKWAVAAAALQDSTWFHEVGPLLTQRGGADVAVLAGTATIAGILSKRGK